MADCVSKERRRELNKKWREEHPGYAKEQHKRWREKNREKWLEHIKTWNKEHPENLRSANNRYHATPRGRAVNLLASYVQFDRKYGMETNMTSEYIEDKITNGRCIWCGETDWRVLGLDRVNNGLPHSIGNVVCSCRACNINRHRKKFGEYAEIRGINIGDYIIEENTIKIC